MKNNQIILLVVGVLILGILIGTLLTRSNPPQIQPTPTNSEQSSSLLADTPVPVATSTPYTGNIIRLAWFYKPPDETEMDLVAERSDLIILTHKDENERSAFKAKGVTEPIAQYLLFLVINDPGGCDENPTGNQVAYKEGDFCQISQEHPDWFLLDEQGNRIQSRSDSYYMDPGNEGFRAFWLERAREIQETHGWDNIFLDNVEGSRIKMVGENGSLAKYPDDASYQRAVEGFLAYIRANYFEPRNKPIYANIVSVAEDEVWDSYLKYVDGVMVESFATDWSDGYRSEDEWEEQMHQVERALAQGKRLILVAQGDQDDERLQNFAFASYLLIANGNAFFRYTNSEAYREVWLYENYNLDLGTPLGNRYQDDGGWRRDFTNGYVIVNPDDDEAQIVINP